MDVTFHLLHVQTQYISRPVPSQTTKNQNRDLQLFRKKHAYNRDSNHTSFSPPPSVLHFILQSLFSCDVLLDGVRLIYYRYVLVLGVGLWCWSLVLVFGAGLPSLPFSLVLPSLISCLLTQHTAIHVNTRKSKGKQDYHNKRLSQQKTKECHQATLSPDNTITRQDKP
jgi:hypothetical protein